MDKPLPFIIEKGKEIMLQKLETITETKDLNQIINILIEEVKSCKRFCDSLKDKEHFDQVFDELRKIAEQIGQNYINKKIQEEKEKKENEKYNELKTKLEEQEQKINKLEKTIGEGKIRVDERGRPYFPIPNYNGCSIVDALKSIGAYSSFDYRCKIAAINGIVGYTGTPHQNIQMLNLLKNGNLLRF